MNLTCGNRFPTIGEMTTTGLSGSANGRFVVSKVLRGGVFGFGGMGQQFTRNINIDKWYGDDFAIVGACNRGEANRRVARETYGLEAFQDPKDLIAMGLDFGLVASTTVAHCEHVCLLAEAGVPIFCEKPIALNLDEGRQMTEAVRKAGVASVVNFGRRMDSCNRKIHDMILKGEFGQLIASSTFMARAHGFYSEGARHRAVMEPEESGGWTVHHACHQVDLACWLMGPVDAVSTVTRSTVEGVETVPGLMSEELVMGRLFFKNGAGGTVFDCVGGVHDSHQSIIGTRCAVGLERAGNVHVLSCKYEGDGEWDPPRIIDPRREFPRRDNLHHFLEVVRDGIPSWVTIADAYYALLVTFAMRESARQNGAVIPIPAE
jgi:predicted dehydrogenase